MTLVKAIEKGLQLLWNNKHEQRSKFFALIDALEIPYKKLLEKSEIDPSLVNNEEFFEAFNKFKMFMEDWFKKKENYQSMKIEKILEN